MKSIRTFVVLLALVSAGQISIALHAESFVAPFSGNLYVQCVGGTGAGVSRFGTGTSPTDFIPYLTGLPSSCSQGEVLVGAVSAGQAVQFAISTVWGSQTYWAFSGGTDAASLIAFSDTNNSLGMGGKIIQQTSQTTWLMHLDDAASYRIDDDDNDILIQLRLAAPATVQQVLPQFCFGGGWYSALYFTNTGSSAVAIPINFIGDDGNPLIVPSAGGSSITLNLPPRGTVMFEAPNIGPLKQGYASVSLPSGAVGYGIFRSSAPGYSDQEAVVPLSSTSSTSSTLIWDDTSLVTAVAIVNPSSVPNWVTVVVRDSAGATIGTSLVPLAGKSKMAVALKDLSGLGAIVGRWGSADFTVSTGNVAVLGLRFGAVAFTSIPTADR